MNSLRLPNILVTVAVSAAMVLGALGMVFSPALAPAASAQSSDFITPTELLPSEFGDEVGLGQGDLRQTIARIIRAALGFLGVIAVVFVLYGGFVWMTAGGNPENVKKAQKIMIAAGTGLAIILSAWAITQFVISQLIGATTFE